MDDGDLTGKLPQEKRKKGKKSKSEDDSVEIVQSKSVSATVRQSIWDRVSQFVNEEYEPADDDYADVGIIVPVIRTKSLFVEIMMIWTLTTSTLMLVMTWVASNFVGGNNPLFLKSSRFPSTHQFAGTFGFRSVKRGCHACLDFETCMYTTSSTHVVCIRNM